MNYRKYKIRNCRRLKECNLCLTNIWPNEKYYDGGSGRRAHLACNDIEGGARFVKWMRGRGDAYKVLPMKFYKDGELYFARQGAEMSLSNFLKCEKELTALELLCHYP
mgnify:FL=1